MFCKSMDWFLSNRDLFRERFKTLFIHHTPSLFLHVVKHNLLVLIFVFHLAFFFRDYSQFRGQQVKGGALSLYPFYHFHPLHKQLGISWVIAAESSPLRITGRRNRKRNLWYTLFRIYSFCTCTVSCCF